MANFIFRPGRFEGPWQDVPWLIDETQKHYDAHITPKGLGDRFSVAAEKIVKARKWEPSLSLIKPNLDSVIRELEIFYVPKQMDPGPAIVFPLRDHHNKIRHAQLKPFYELTGRSGPMKYSRLGKGRSPITWFGDRDPTLLSIGKYSSVMLVEGYFDLLACRLLHPTAPILSTGTKKMNDVHLWYLQMLGVKTIHLMFDNEIAKEGKDEGAGNQAARFVAQQFQGQGGVEFQIQACPATDPSACLEDKRTAYHLRSMLHRRFPVESAVDEDLD